MGYFEARHLGLYGRIWWGSYLYRYVPGKVFLLVERARMGSAVGIPPAAGAALAVIETLFSILAAAWVSLLALSYYAGDSDAYLEGVALLSTGMLFLLPIGYRFVCGLPVIKRNFPELEKVTLRLPDIIAAMPAFILHFLLLGLSFFLCIRSLYELTWVNFPGLCGVYALSHMIGLVTVIAPGGLGVREGALSVQLAHIIPSGLPEVIALGARMWFTLIELVSYLAMLIICPRLSQTVEQDPTMEPVEPEAL